MQSKITIELDFDTATPFIRVFCNHTSTDLRDRTVNEFFEKLKHSSRWGTITYKHSGSKVLVGGETTSFSEWHILPVKPADLRQEAALMIAMADHLEGQIKAEAPEVNT